MVVASAIILVVGGLVFFIFGLQVITRAFQRLSGVWLKVAVNLLASNRALGVAVGTVMSFLLASTSGATVLLVGMGDAGLITLRQALAVVLGAAIGTTLTVQLIAFDIGPWSLGLVAAGFLVRTFSRYERGRDIGNVLFGVGLLFYGLSVMKGGVETAFRGESFYGVRQFFTAVSANPFYLFLGGIVATAVLQSSATTLALAFAFSQYGLTVGAAIPIAIGASVGTGVAGLVSGIGGKPVGRQIAVGHFLMKLIGASFFMFILAHFTQSVESWSAQLGFTSKERVIANANTLYNVLNAVIFLPLIPVIEELVRSITGRSGLPAAVGGMSISDLDDPPRAVRKAHDQVVRMSRAALEMLRKDLPAFLVNAHRSTDDILAGEDNLDTFDAVLSDFLARIEDAHLPPDDAKHRSRLLYIVKDVEHIGDILASELVPLARKKARKGLDFSIEGAQQFDRLHRLVADDFAEAVDLLEGLPANPARVFENASRIDRLRRAMVESHIRRISQGVRADAETTRILLDAVAALRMIHYYAYDIVKVLDTEPRTTPPSRAASS